MRRLIALAALAANGAYAQNTTVYGVIDQAVEHLSGGGLSITRLPGVTSSTPSRLGFRGSEDLGGGLRAVFTLEMGIAPDAGGFNQGGRVFGRQSFVGLSGPWGTLSLGRQYTMLFWSQLDSGTVGPNLFGASALDSYLPNARADNSIAYRGTFSGFTAGATYSLGRDTVNAGPTPAGTNCAGESATDAQACREWSAMLKFDDKAWGVSAAVDEIRGGPGAFAGLTRSALTDRRSALGGWARFDKLKLGAGLLARRNQASAATPKSMLWSTGAGYELTPQFLLEGEYFKLDFKNSVNMANLWVMRGTYSFSKRTAVYATAGRVNNDGTLAMSVSSGASGTNPVAGGSQTGIAAGIRHSF